MRASRRLAMIALLLAAAAPQAAGQQLASSFDQLSVFLVPPWVTGLDVIFRSNEAIFSRPARTSASLTLSPFITRGRAGTLFSVGF